MQEFFDHFEKLMSSDDNFCDETNEDFECVFEELDRPFTEAEIECCINSLHRDKATGIDNILNEY